MHTSPARSPRAPRDCHQLLWRLLALALGFGSIAPASAQTTGTTRPTTGNSSSSNSSSSSNNSRSSGTTSNSNSAGVTRTYRNATQLGDALIQIDPETRSLIIVADEETQKEITHVIQDLDRPKPQVLIKVLFAQVTLDNSTDFGVEGSYAFNVGQPAAGQAITSAVQAITGAGSTSGSSTSGTTTSTSPTQTTTTTTTKPTSAGGTKTTATTVTQGYPAATTGFGGPGTNFGLSNETTGGFFRLNTQNATATLYALATKGKVSVLSRPSILARNNQQAVIVVGQEVPIPTSNQITDTGQQIQSVSYQDVGIILRVTPFITVNKTVEMIVSPEISSLSTQTVALSSSFSAPIINKTAAETVVVTPDQTTVVIGGLMQKQVTSQVNKVPILGDIPILGNAFKHTTKTEDKTELLIFLTPYIVEGTDKLDSLTVDQVNRTDLPSQAFAPGDVSQYLDSTLSLMPEAKAQVVPGGSPAPQTMQSKRATGR